MPGGGLQHWPAGVTDHRLEETIETELGVGRSAAPTVILAKIEAEPAARDLSRPRRRSRRSLGEVTPSPVNGS